MYRRNKNDQLKAKYKTAENKFSSAVDRFNTAKENEVINSGNIGSFYSYVNSKLVTKSGVGALKNSSGQLVHDDEEKASVLNECYSNIFTKDDGVLPDFPPKVVNAALDTVDFNCSVVYRQLQELKAKASSGPDGLSAVFLKKISPFFVIAVINSVQLFVQLWRFARHLEAGKCHANFQKGSDKRPK